MEKEPSLLLIAMVRGSDGSGVLVASKLGKRAPCHW